MSLIRKIKEAFCGDPVWASFLAFVFSAMISTPIARLMLVVTLVCLVASKENRKRFCITAPTFGWLTYLAVALLVSLVAVTALDDPLLVPKKGLGKITKLVWYIAIPITAAMITNRERMEKTLKVLVSGAILLSLIVIVGNPLKAWLQIAYPNPMTSSTATGFPLFLYQVFSAIGLDGAVCDWLYNDAWTKARGFPLDIGRPPSFYLGMLASGSMDDSQRLMVAFIVALGLFPKVTNLRRPVKTAILAIIMLGLIVTCKRGPLLATVAVSFFILARRINIWRTLLLVACLVGAIFAVPSARQRFSALPQEFDPSNGGRMLMWTKIVPELHKEHPFGIGFRSLTSKKMESIDKNIEPHRTHVHSTPLQAFVDFGYLGVCAWLFWMLSSLVSARRASGSSLGGSASMVGPILALILFGLVEYNLADAAEVLLYSITMGLASPFYLNHGNGRRSEIAFLEKNFIKPYDDKDKLRGVEIFNLNLVRDLADLGKSVFLPIDKTWEPVFRERIPKLDNVKLYTISNMCIPALTAFGAGIAIASESRACGKIKSLFVANDANGLSMAICLIHRLKVCEQMVVLAHKLPSKAFAHMVAKIKGHIVCVCKTIADDFKNYAPIANVASDYGITAADGFYPREGDGDDEKVNFCLLGDMTSEWKGADTVIEALGMLSPDDRSVIKLHIKSLPENSTLSLPEEVVSHPWTPMSTIPSFLRDMDVMIVASRNGSDGRIKETFSQTVVQGMLTELPIIHTSIAPFVEKFDNGGGIQADTPEEIARAMSLLIKDKALRQRLGKEARATALERYVWSTERFYRRYFE